MLETIKDANKQREQAIRPLQSGSNEPAYPTFFDCRESTSKQKDEKTVLDFLALFQTLNLQLCR